MHSLQAFLVCITEIFFLVWFQNIGVWDLNYRQRLRRAQPFSWGLLEHLSPGEMILALALLCNLSQRLCKKQSKIKQAVDEDLNFSMPVPICGIIMQSYCFHPLKRNIMIFYQSSSSNILFLLSVREEMGL